MARVALLALLALGCQTDDDVIATLRATAAEPSPCALAPGATPALARYDFDDAAGATTLRDAHGLADAQLVDGSFAPAALD